ncbi:Mss4-like protein [Pyronema omphalodes]|nr:Mss4-like protein [Pyronema omphalodes]
MATTNITQHTEILTGHCFCGQCTYTINPTIPLSETQQRFITELGTNILPFHDHCSDCRRATSGLVTSYFIIPPPYISFDPNSPLKTFRSSNGTVERTFCADCGTQLTYQRLSAQEYLGTIDVTIGTLCERDLQRLDELGLTPTKLHVWWADGVRWYQREVVGSAEENKIRAFREGNLKPELEVEIVERKNEEGREENNLTEQGEES